MNIQFEDLPVEILIEAFSLLSNSKLKEIIFLNNKLFKIIKEIVIKEVTFKETIKKIDQKQEIEFKQHPLTKLNLIKVGCYSKSIGLKIFTQIKNFSIYIGDWVSEITFDNFPNLKYLELAFYDNNLDMFNTSNIKKDLLFNLHTLNLKISKDINLNEIINYLNPNKLKNLKVVTNDNMIKVDNVSKFKRFEVLKDLFIDGKVLDFEASPIPENEEIILPNLNNLRVSAEDYKNSEFKVFGKLLDLTKITLLVVAGEYDTNEFVKQANINNAILNYWCARLTSQVNHNLNVKDLILGLKPIFETKKFTAVDITRLNHLKSNQASFNEKFDSFNMIQSIGFIACTISIQVVFEIISFFPNAIKVKLKDCFLDSSNNDSIILPSKLNDFLFISDSKSLCGCQDKLHLLKDIDTYIY